MAHKMTVLRSASGRVHVMGKYPLWFETGEILTRADFVQHIVEKNVVFRGPYANRNSPIEELLTLAERQQVHAVSEYLGDRLVVMDCALQLLRIKTRDRLNDADIRTISEITGCVVEKLIDLSKPYNQEGLSEFCSRVNYGEEDIRELFSELAKL